jgi:hypothetical protein
VHSLRTGILENDRVSGTPAGADMERHCQGFAIAETTRQIGSQLVTGGMPDAVTLQKEKPFGMLQFQGPKSGLGATRINHS